MTTPTRAKFRFHNTGNFYGTRLRHPEAVQISSNFSHHPGDGLYDVPTVIFYDPRGKEPVMYEMKGYENLEKAIEAIPLEILKWMDEKTIEGHTIIAKYKGRDIGRDIDKAITDKLYRDGDEDL